METCVVVESLISIYYIRKREVGIGPAANCEAKEEIVSRRHSIDKTGSRYFRTFTYEVLTYLAIEFFANSRFTVLFSGKSKIGRGDPTFDRAFRGEASFNGEYAKRTNHRAKSASSGRRANVKGS